MLKETFILASFSIFLMAINIAGQEGGTGQGNIEHALPSAPTDPLLTDQYLPGAQPIGGITAFDPYRVVTGKPFRAQVNAREISNNSAGMKVIYEYHGTIARDSQGRVFQEMFASPQTPPGDGRGSASGEHQVRVVDPLKKTEMIWSGGNNTAYETTSHPFYTNPQPLDRCDADRTGVTAARNYASDRTQRSESMGERVIQGIATRGCRVYTEIPADAAAGRSAYTIIDESWTSPELRAPLLRTHHDPHARDQITRLDKIVPGEPETAIFQPPADYRILDPQGDDLPTPAFEKAKQLHPWEFKSPLAIEHKNESIVMTIDEPRPLLIAIDFLRLKYNWKIDYEDPPYISEVIDANDPVWRATHQPAPAKPGTMVPAGSRFRSEYAESLAQLATIDGEKQILEKIVTDYNLSGNPGKFAVRQEADGRFAVVGISSKDAAGKDIGKAPILDTPLTIPGRETTAWKAVQLILDELTRKTGRKVLYFAFADNGMMQRKLTIRGENVAVRELLLQAIGEKGVSRNWSLLYDPNEGGQYGFNTGGHWMKSAPQ